MTERPGVQLISYADRLAPDLPALGALLASPPWDAAFRGIHILPFFTPHDGADAGFDPVDHRQVDPRLGDWSDIAAIAARGAFMADVIVNHVSADSAAFRDVLAKGDASEHADMFLTMSSVFPDGATEQDLTAIYRPRPGVPFTPYTAGGVPRLFWTTFTPQQIDIDVHTPAGSEYLESILVALERAGASMIRLDAVGYAIKTAGSSSFMTPETFAFIDEFSARAHRRGLEVLVEVHSPHQTQVAIAKRVDRVYDFALPPLLLHALATADADPLLGWMRIRPENAVNVLDTHDGIGVIDIGPGDDGTPGLVTPEQLDALVEGIHERSGGSSRRATGAAASNLDLYQVNSTYYDALGRDDTAYLTARAVQLLLPGVPQIYYVGALAGVNDEELLARTHVGRDVNRHYYTADEVSAELERPVVRALFALCALRNRLTAFDGEFAYTVPGPGLLTLRWDAGADSVELAADFARRDAVLRWSEGGESHELASLLHAAALLD